VGCDLEATTAGVGPHLPDSLVLAALLVSVVVVSRVGAAHRVSDAVGALYSATEAWRIGGRGRSGFVM